MIRAAWRVLGYLLLLQLCLFLGFAGWQMWQSRDGAVVPKPPGTVRIATHNVHFIWMNRDAGRWSRGDWDRRKGALDAAFKALDADIVAFQEMESFAGGNDDTVNLARGWILRNNPDFAAAAVGDWRAFPSTQPILYRADRFELVDQGWFFFSETPDVIYSPTFTESYPAFASWAVFTRRDGGARFRVLNAHLDFSSIENRRKSGALIAERIRPWISAGETVILAADLNALWFSGVHDRLEAAGLTFLPVRGATYHFDRGLNLFGAIDHLAHAGAAEPVGRAMVLRDSYGGVWPSDHYPVVADFRLGP